MSDITEGLLELASVDEVEAYIPTSTEHDLGITPTWCEVVLKIRRAGDWPVRADLPLRRHDAELIVQCLHEVLHPARSSVAGEQMWDQLDACVDRIQRRVNKGKEPMRKDVGEAFGLASAIAAVNNPMEPDIDDVRATAMQRWSIRHGVPLDPDEDDD
jgi:hypothetical protein